MDPRGRAQDVPSPEAVEFVRFCYRRRRAGWPELYDEMCAVAGRGIYQGWTHAELAEHGIGFSLFELPALAALVGRVVAEEADRRRAQGPGSATERLGTPGAGYSDDRAEPTSEPVHLAVATAG